MKKNRKFIVQAPVGESESGGRKGRFNMKVIHALMFMATSAVLASSAMPAFAEAAAEQSAASAQLAVQQGKLQGLVTDHREFRGIPFAAPPVGDLRFRAPQAPAAWSGVRDATQFRGPCPQPGRMGSTASTNEDCLFLNIYTPLEGANLPVMVWIHGGGFTSSTANSYTAATLAKKGKAVLVTIDYRLGALGLLATPGMAAENADGASGNFALLDQQAALRWIKTNITAFGGNPNNVTIVGHSAGGASVCAHLITPSSKDLFHKGIVQSGPCDMAIATKQDSYQTGKAFATGAKCANDDPAKEMACLRALPVDQVLAAQAGIRDRVVGDTTLRLTIDGATLKGTSADVIRSGQFNRVPLIVGSTRVEGRGFAYAAYDLTGKKMTAEQYPQVIRAIYGASADKVLAKYPLANYPAPVDAFATMLGDSRFSCNTRTLIRDLAEQRATVYPYEFRDPNPPLIPKLSLGPTHGAELQYVFQDKLALNDASALSPQQLQLSNQMQSYWTNFARTGDPNASGLPKWNIYSTKSDQFFGFTSEPPGTADYAGFSAEHHCDFWGEKL